MSWANGPSEERELQGGSHGEHEEGPAPEGSLGPLAHAREGQTEDLLSEVSAVAEHLRELQRRLGTYRRQEGEEPGAERQSVPPPENGSAQHVQDASEHVAAIIGAAEAAAAEIRARAEAHAAEIVANAESNADRIRVEAKSEERRLFDAIDALRPAAAEFQHAIERVHDAAVAALMSYPRD